MDGVDERLMPRNPTAWVPLTGACGPPPRLAGVDTWSDERLERLVVATAFIGGRSGSGGPKKPRPLGRSPADHVPAGYPVGRV
jgi:hypothetical protein